jgi:peptidoglycan/xylan/chitin deacetylase (PgdA/CDA1 family)
MRSKRELIAQVSASVGLTKLLEWLPKRDVLIGLNYHRIGSAADSPYDPNIFSATAEEFFGQIAYIRKRFHFATLEESLEMANGTTPPGTSVLITFDDGYLDNYTVAYPILKSYGIPAAFFLPTAFIGSSRLPWWDEIAFIVKKSRNRRIRLSYPRPVVFDLDSDGEVRVCMNVLRLYRQPAVADTDRFISELEGACETSRPNGSAERSFLNWDEAREMQAHGMAFGSHGHNHKILSKISVKDQEQEVRISRQVLECELGRKIDIMAYPVGARDCFTGDTVAALKRAGYRAAFSYYGGVNRAGRTDLFDIQRYGVGDQSRERLRLQTALVSVTERGWF